jgi:hypothetical protein
MDRIPGHTILLRPAVRVSIYRAALGTYNRPCLGFLFGSERESAQPCFDFAVVGVVLAAWDGANYESGLEGLKLLIQRAHLFSQKIGKDLLGLWVAWDYAAVDNSKARLTELLDLARSESIPWVLEAPMEGGDAIFALPIYDVQKTSPQPVHYATTKRSVLGKMDNSRRITSMWKSVKKPSYPPAIR